MSDPILESIVGSLISAAASIVVALIGRSRSEPSGKTPGSRPVVRIPRINRFCWGVMVTILVCWCLGAPLLLDWKWAGVNLFLLFPVSLIISAIWPIRPFWAASIVLMLYALHLLLLAAWQQTEGGYQDMGGNTAIILGLAVFTAFSSWLIARWRSARYIVSDENARREARARPSSKDRSVADEIAKLHDLRRSGVLTEEEFQAAKSRLLDP